MKYIYINALELFIIEWVFWLRPISKNHIKPKSEFLIHVNMCISIARRDGQPAATCYKSLHRTKYTKTSIGLHFLYTVKIDTQSLLLKMHSSQCMANRLA